ncbi:dTMP kinase [Emcibacter sp. SYSU 3D8]|uniref:dTMP kinase n=1 Tax=Emcibacter sp. SYSU 3D8 TaxID=3133969 RepID=UPI0031FE5D92
MPRRGIFVTFEGGEGAGKSTQLGLLAARLRLHGIGVVETREPNGPIRNLLVQGDRAWTPMAETLLHFAARAEHLADTIVPSLDEGAWVLCDRFADSTMAYQGYAQQLGRPAVEKLYRLVAGRLKPDLTLVLDMPVALGLDRTARRQGNETRYEQMGRKFHDAVHEAFLDIAAREPERCVLIDANRPVETVHEAIWASVENRFKVG